MVSMCAKVLSTKMMLFEEQPVLLCCWHLDLQLGRRAGEEVWTSPPERCQGHRGA